MVQVELKNMYRNTGAVQIAAVKIYEQKTLRLPVS